MKYGITSESQLIDKKTIAEACQRMREIAKDFVDSGKKVSEAAGMCTTEVISVDGLSLSPNIEALGEYINSAYNAICKYADSIEEVANQVYNEQHQELIQYIESLKEQKNSN